MRPFATFCLLASATWAQSADALFENARKAQVAGQIEQAESAYRQYLKSYSPRPEVLANLGALLARREQYNEAIDLYQKALRLDPSLFPLHLNLGLAYLKGGHPAPSVEQFDLFLKSQPQHRQAMQLRAMALLETERYDQSEQQYRALLPSDDVTVTLGLATALLRQGKAAEARSVLEPVLSHGTSAEAQLALGQILLQEGRIDDALESLRQAERMQPNLPHLRYTLGSVFWRQRKTDAALEQWRSEQAANPQSFEATYALGSALSLNPATSDQGEALLRKAVSMRPGNARANFQLAKLVWQKAKKPEALQFLKRATSTDPQFREAFFLQANVLQTLGRKAEAAASFAHVKKLSEKELSRQQDLFSELP